MVRCRPPSGGRGGAGSKGSTSAQSSSGTRSSARVVMTRSLPDQPQRSETTPNCPRRVPSYLRRRMQHRSACAALDRARCPQWPRNPRKTGCLTGAPARQPRHWAIEYGLHHARDFSPAEDASQMRTGAGPHVAASLRNLDIGVLSGAEPINLAAAYGITSATPPDPSAPSGSPTDEPDIPRERRSPDRWAGSAACALGAARGSADCRPSKGAGRSAHRHHPRVSGPAALLGRIVWAPGLIWVLGPAGSGDKMLDG
jgi:hypothetical protein